VVKLLGIDKEYIKDRIDSVRDAIGRNVTIYTPKTTACLECVASGWYDAATNSSFNITCPQCNGVYWLASVDSIEILARIHWVSNEGIVATPGGKYFLGDAQITVDPCHTELLQSAQNEMGKVVVDGQDMQIMRINPMGAPEVNRVRAILKSMGARREV
jgi:hypothetical protein